MKQFSQGWKRLDVRHSDRWLVCSLMCAGSLNAKGENKAGTQRRDEIQRESCDNISRSHFPVGPNESLLHGLEEYDVNIFPVRASFCLSQLKLYFCHLQPKEAL